MRRAKSFLKELAEEVVASGQPLEKLTFVFPNRRAIVFFKQALQNTYKKPAQSPKLLTIESFISSFHDHQPGDRLELVAHLHRVFNRVMSSSEPFDSFYFWGDMLLRDFNEIDKYLVPPYLLYRQVKALKEIDINFDDFDEEQRAFLEKFWSSVEKGEGKNTKAFIRLWENLFTIYKSYRDELLTNGIVYEGMLYREVAEKVIHKKEFRFGQNELQFVGFNAITPAEKKIMSHCVNKGWAVMHWDADSYYMDNPLQEAGHFLRSLREHNVLGKTFPENFPAHLSALPRINTYSTGLATGQARCLGQQLTECLSKENDEEDTLIVLPDEKLLIPVLNAVAGAVGKINVTMGYPLAQTPAVGLAELLFDMQLKATGEAFFFKHLQAVLTHPYIQACDTRFAYEQGRKIAQSNSPWITPGQMGDHDLYRIVFGVWSGESLDILNQLRSIFNHVGVHLGGPDKEFVAQVLTLLNRMEKLFVTHSSTLGSADRKGQLRSWLKLFRSLVRSLHVPFMGEPLEGLQIMGMLETRCLDFKNVYILSLNDGTLPPSNNEGSFIPYSLRRAYAMPVQKHQDAVYAYLFYRAIQRAENVSLFYVSESDVLGQGEKSRFLQQLAFESQIPIEQHTWAYQVNAKATHDVVVHKSPEMIDKMLTYFGSHGLSPSAINTYLDCRIRFFYQYVAGIKTTLNAKKEISPAMLGSLLHEVLEEFYKPFEGKTVQETDLDKPEKQVQELMNTQLRNNFDAKPGQLAGEQLIVWEVVQKFALAVLAADKAYAPFMIEAVEMKFDEQLYPIPLAAFDQSVSIRGLADRVDRKGPVARVIDYKTGKDWNDFKDIASLFDEDLKDRNKAVLQLLLYTLLYQRATPPKGGLVLQPALMSRGQLFGGNTDNPFQLTMHRHPMNDVAEHLPELEKYLVETVNNMFDQKQPFHQTSVTTRCRYCPYNNICNR